MIPVFIYFFLQSYGITKMWLKSPFAMSWVSAPIFHFFIPSNQPFSNVEIPVQFIQFIPIIFGMICLALLILPDYKQKMNKALLVSWLLTIFIFLSLATFPPHIPYHHRFTLIAAPFLYLLLGIGLNQVYEKRKTIFYVLMIVWIVIQGIMYITYYINADRELTWASDYIKPYCINHSIVLHESAFSLLPLRATNPDCIHIIQTSLDYNTMLTAGGSVIDSKYFNNASIIPDLYVYAKEMGKIINCNKGLCKVMMNQTKEDLYAEGRVVFDKNNLEIMIINKSSYRMKNKQDLTIKKFVFDVCVLFGNCG